MIKGSTRLVFILGHPVEHSLSPVFQNEAFRKLKLPYVYVPLDVHPRHLPNVIDAIRCENVQGANVTVPLKTLVLNHLDQLEPEARYLNSVNTIYKKKGRLHGTSTDGEGFLRALGSWRKTLRGSIGMMIGAGGAARSVGYALVQSGVKTLKIANWKALEVENLVRDLRKKFPRVQLTCMSLQEGEKSLSDCDWIIQATSLGLKKGEPSPLSLNKASSASWVVDLIYHRQTEFLKQAEKSKIPFKNGLGMLLQQGALSFELWTAKKAPLREMSLALTQSLDA
jgi:shikimate dehydrogenase